MFIHSLNKNLWRAYYGPNPVLDSEEMVVNKTKQKRLPGTLFLMEKNSSKDTDVQIHNIS